MARNVSISIPHSLGQEEAKKRIDVAVRQLSRRYAQYVSALEADWVGNRLTGQLRALGQTVSGHVAVEPAEIQLDLNLPVVVAMLSGKIEAFAMRAGRRVLS